MFMDVTRKYQLLVDYAYRKKSILIKLMVVFVNVQGLIIDTCARYGAIDCVAPFLSASAVADIIKALLLLSQSLVLGCWAFRMYTTDNVLD